MPGRNKNEFGKRIIPSPGAMATGRNITSVLPIEWRTCLTQDTVLALSPIPMLASWLRKHCGILMERAIVWATLSVMPNHVHVLVQPNEGRDLSSILHSWKSFTAGRANTLLKREGPFWRDEYFDHLIRSETQYRKFCDYIQENPRLARLPEGKFRLGKGTFNLPECAASVSLAENKELTALQSAKTSREIPLGSGTATCRQDAGSTLVSSSCRQDAGSTLSSSSSPPDAGSTFLLHGVTGSGKTEIYLQAIAHALEQGKGAIVLVPEISLTPQTVERFKARFSSGPLQTLVAVLHSHLSAGERHDEWHKIRQGRARIVIGARSAIFAPVDPLGLDHRR